MNDIITNKNVKTFIRLCTWLTKKEFDYDVPNRRYNARHLQMQEIRATLTTADIAALYLSGTVDARFCKL